MPSILSKIHLRESTRWLFLAVVIAALYCAPDLSPPPAPRVAAAVAPKKAPAIPKKAKLPAKPVAPKGPSAFALEEAMSLHELMARWIR